MLPGRKRELDLGRQRGLLRPWLVAREDVLEAPTGPEESVHGD
jgi:hypothetical protein